MQMQKMNVSLLLVLSLMVILSSPCVAADLDIAGYESLSNHRNGFLFSSSKISDGTGIKQNKIQSKIVDRQSRHLLDCTKTDWSSSCNIVLAYQPPNASRMKIMKGERPSMVYDANCLKRHRLTIQQNGKDVGSIAYYATQRLRNHGDGSIDTSPYTKTIVMQHGAFRDADIYYCLMQQLVYAAQQQYKYNTSEVLVIAPNFNYKTDYDVYASDAFFNISKVCLHSGL
jgi:hypothetical protein